MNNKYDWVYIRDFINSELSTNFPGLFYENKTNIYQFAETMFSKNINIIPIGYIIDKYFQVVYKIVTFGLSKFFTYKNFRIYVQADKNNIRKLEDLMQSCFVEIEVTLNDQKVDILQILFLNKSENISQHSLFLKKANELGIDIDLFKLKLMFQSDYNPLYDAMLIELLLYWIDENIKIDGKKVRKHLENIKEKIIYKLEEKYVKS